MKHFPPMREKVALVGVQNAERLKKKKDKQKAVGYLDQIEAGETTQLKCGKDLMDKQIRKIEKKVKGTEKSLKSLEKADKKRDKVCDLGKKMMKKKGKR